MKCSDSLQGLAASAEVNTCLERAKVGIPEFAEVYGHLELAQSILSCWDSWNRCQTVSINKAINAQEVAVKEKHARTCILGTHHEKGAQTFWSVVNRLPLSGNAVLCWKFCHVFHKLLRDGHSNVLKDSVRYKNELSDMSRMWGHLSEGYGQLCSIYLKLLRTKMEFHTKNPRFPGNLQMSDRQLDEAGENDVNNFFQLTVEMFDYLECELNLFQTVFSSLDMSRSVSVTAAGQCRLAPLIQVILDCSHLYDYTVKLLFKLHSCLPADTLQGHRDRFLEQFRKLKDLFYRSSNLQYFKRLIQIPQLPENPPNFLRASALSEHISPVVVIPAEASSPDSEPITDLVEMDTASQSLFDNKFDDIFGSSFSCDPFNFNSQNGMSKDDKDRLIEQLYGEITGLKEELENFKAESTRGAVQLRGRASELEAELAEQQHLKQQAQDESEFLRTELEELKKQREDTEKAQRSLTEIERRAQANEQRYSKLKEKYSELVQNHADLLRKNAEVTKQITVARQAQGDVEREKKELEDSFQRLSEQAQRKFCQPLPLLQSQEQAEVLETLKRELAASKQELQVVQGTLESSTQAGAEQNTRIASLEQERDRLSRAAEQHRDEMAALQAELQQLQDTLSSEQENSRTELETLQTQLRDKGTAREAERMVQDALTRMEDPAHISCTGSADCLLSRTLAASECAERLRDAHSKYLLDGAAVGSLLPCLALFAHLVSDTLLQGSATSHVAPVEPADRLLELCKQCGSAAVSYLSALQDPGTVASADCSLVTACLGQISAIGEELRPRGLDVRQEELGDLVDKEMAATAAAIETASARIEEMLSKARAGDTGVKLEVNERILGSCTGLMQAIHVLVLASKDLQREIVESGRGAASPKEFYAKNSRWTEGLISASKAVGWGATVMVDAADLVVQGKGTFEELMVCSREIAASTAQLVAASKVKADKDSTNLCKLQQASRGVNQATASVVASTKAGKSQVEEKDSMDFSGMTLTQIKRQEMDSQVRVLELENQLQKERQKLGELRKKHYELAGVAEGWEEEAAD
ncbi:PREDICTED: huntingtin-interacting protein 1 isoform X3 [Corvus brachyrhynchos]|uniref:huntingtin-interacting protein 1 isoform X3 n=1 Tax=Corvus brachyrhynchos TaxID=85066 RepID=UPI0008163600|nr:PREDICTED: huntingtin-interacting protein 1 isoform X3 [Corvus brachyrhynchos]